MSDEIVVIVLVVSVVVVDFVVVSALVVFLLRNESSSKGSLKISLVAKILGSNLLPNLLFDAHMLTNSCLL